MVSFNLPCAQRDRSPPSWSGGRHDLSSAWHVLILSFSAPSLPCPSITTSLEGIYGLSSWLPSHTSVRPFLAKSRFTARKPSLDHPVHAGCHFMTSTICILSHALYRITCFRHYMSPSAAGYRVCRSKMCNTPTASYRARFK